MKPKTKIDPSVSTRCYRIRVKRKVLPVALVLLRIGVLGACTSHPAPNAKPTSAFRVALLTPGPVSDAGWNAAAYEGLELIKTRLGADTALVQTKSPADFEDAFRDFASRGFDLIFAHGFEYTDSAIQLAQSFPNTC